MSLATLVVVAGCFPDWDSLDPSLGTETTATTGGGGIGGTGGDGGTSSTGGQGGTPSGGVGGNEGGGGMGPIGPWSTPEIVPELSHPEDDDDPTLTADGLELFINSRREGNTDIYVSTRDSLSDPWSTPVNVPELNSPNTETNQTVSPDGLTMWLYSSRDDPMNIQLYISTRSTRSSVWSTPAVLTEVEDENINDVAGVTLSGLIMMGHASSMDMEQELFQLERQDTADPWGPKVLLPELNSAEGDNEAWMSPDGLNVFLCSSRVGSLGQRDIWSSSRRSLTDPFDTPVNETLLNHDKDDSDPTLTPDLRYILFARPVGMDGEREIFVSTR